MIVNSSYISKGGSEVTLECEFREKYTVSIADAKRLGVYGLEDGEFPVEVDEEQVIFLSKKLMAIKYATYLLQFSDKSERVLRLKMREKDYENDVIDEALGVLRSGGIINDESLALKKYISLAFGKLYGPSRIRQELFAKGFAQGDIREAEQKAGVDFDALLSDLCQKLLSGGKADLSDRKQYDKLFSKLLRYGYNSSQIQRAIKNVSLDGIYEDW